MMNPLVCLSPGFDSSFGLSSQGLAALVVAGVHA
jgi:hypothetical protein